ncbi:MAG: energy transducer TonB [Oceanospirillaceae bacterium]|nr:energy transducer TonB [Oceanospirillaceae bacterium]
MQDPIVRLIKRPLMAMLLLSGSLHLLLFSGWAAPVLTPAGDSVTELQLNLHAVQAHPLDSGATVDSRAPLPPVPDATAQAARPAVAAPAPRPTPKLAENPAPVPQPESPPADPAPARPTPAPEPAPAPRYQPPGQEPEAEDPFEELLSDHREVVAAADAPVERDPQWRRPPQPPVYPPLARRRGQEGEVMLRLDIDARGEVTGARVLNSSGHPLLDRAAREAGLGWQLMPARINGIAVASYVTIPVQFRLH